MEIIYGQKGFVFFGTVNDLITLLGSLPHDISVVDYLRLRLH